MPTLPSDSLKLQCIYCGHRQTIRVRPGAGRSWTCKGKPGQKCGKVNPGPSVITEIVRHAISTGQLIVGKRAKKRRPPAGAPATASAGQTGHDAAAPTAGTTVGRRATVSQKPPAKKPATVVPPPKPKPARAATPPAKPSESSRSLGSRVLGVLKEAIV